MFNNEQLQGILITIARPEITTYRSKSKTGWTIRTRVMFRAKRGFLIALQRKFEQLEISSILREMEGVNRKAPVLIIGKQESINKLRSIMPKHIPCSHADWEIFDTVIDIIKNKLHLEEDGMKRLRELLDNENKNKKV
tara:strand:- start:3670 stop:4083 length:414 start_codon:yes stop_codon:yes gene_type:complete